MSRKKMSDIVRKCHDNYTYRYDEDKYGRMEYWEPQEEAVLRGDKWEGDCEDWAMTALLLAMDEGIPKEDCGLAYVRTHRGEGHAVLWYRAADGVLWEADCNFSKLVKQWTEKYEYVSYMSMDDPTNWKSYS